MSKDRDTGTLVFWSDSGGYSFIRPDAAGEWDVFAHASAHSRDPRIGDRVTYEVAKDRLQRPRAKTLRSLLTTLMTASRSCSKGQVTNCGKRRVTMTARSIHWHRPCVAHTMNEEPAALHFILSTTSHQPAKHNCTRAGKVCKARQYRTFPNLASIRRPPLLRHL
jgi:cold shock CspA family protein